MLGQHYISWNSYCAESWMVEVLCSGYCIPFHHLPSVTWEPREFSSYSSGSVWAQALQDEVNKILMKGALVDCLGLGFYNHLFIVQKATGGWQPVVNLLALKGFFTLTKFWMEMVSSVLGSIWRGDVMSLVDLKDAYFQILIHPDSQPYLQIALSSQVYQLKVVCFGLLSAPQVFTRVFILVLEWAHRRGSSCFATWTISW